MRKPVSNPILAFVGLARGEFGRVFRAAATKWILILALAGTATAQIQAPLDMVAIAAGSQVVTLGAIRRQLRLEQLTSGDPVPDTPESRRRAASRLLDQNIIHREIELSRFTPPTMAEAEKAIEQYLKNTGRTRERLLAEIHQLGFSEDDFKREVQWRLSVSRFIDFRFAPGVSVTDEEIAEYYRGTFTANFQKLNPGGEPPPLEEVQQSIRRILITRKTNTTMEQWLGRMRESLHVRYFEEAFQVKAGTP